jgi:hypothetical protein
MLRLLTACSLFAFASLSTAQQTCSTTLVAASCGPQLAITFTPVGGAGNHTIELTCSGLDPNGIGVMIWGVQQTFVPLPSCPLLTEFVWGHIVNLDATGSHTWSRSWPASVDGYFLIQFGSLTVSPSGNWNVLSTDLMRAQCGG